VVPLVLLLLAGVGAGVWRMPARSATPAQQAGGPLAQAVREVARPEESVDGGSGAEPETAPSPARNATAMKSPPPATSPSTEPSACPEEKHSSSRSALLLLATCACLDAGCPSPAVPVVRQPPPGEECPPGALATKKELGIGLKPNFESKDGLTLEVTHRRPRTGSNQVTVQEGPTSDWFVDGRDSAMGALGDGTVLTGKLLFGWNKKGEERIFGRFTHATTPDGRTWPVCLELFWNTEGWGMEMQRDSGGNAHMPDVQSLRWVDRFHY
jgi:serine/threonine-protein kinase